MFNGETNFRRNGGDLAVFWVHEVGGLSAGLLFAARTLDVPSTLPRSVWAAPFADDMS